MQPKTSTDVHLSADEEIQNCLNLDDLRSFFLFAGAGSGKTRALVNALKVINDKYGRRLLFSNKKVAVITYTNAATDEIVKRVEFNSLFTVSTIHSFIWSLIKPFPVDIKNWVVINIQEEMNELKELIAKGRPGTKTEIARLASLESKGRRLKNLESVKVFNYNPNGENSGVDSLNHSEVIKIGANFLQEKPLMKQLLISQFPILLIDESQDTNKDLIEAFLGIEAEFIGKFLLGLFGDTMQRIYLDGKPDLGKHVPEHWAKPSKLINHRSGVRIIDLINKIRISVDDHQQTAVDNDESGFVRLFVVSFGRNNKDAVETQIQNSMAVVTDDLLWNVRSKVKKLILEHHMAASRLGFSTLFESLYGVDRFKTGILDGTSSAVRMFSNYLLPALLARRNNDQFSLINVIQKNSPLLRKQFLQENKETQIEQLKKAVDAVTMLFENWHDKNPSFLELLRIVHSTELFEVPSILLPFVEEKVIAVNDEGTSAPPEEEEKNVDLDEYQAIQDFLNSPFNQIENYSAYINQQTEFDTHQGIKGREFERVMVIMDDNDSRGFLFKYEKLFGVEPLSRTDLDNQREGKDTSISRATRLFYVTCSRAEKSLAIVAYTKSTEQVKQFAVKSGWFQETEVEIVE